MWATTTLDTDGNNGEEGDGKDVDGKEGDDNDNDGYVSDDNTTRTFCHFVCHITTTPTVPPSLSCQHHNNDASISFICLVVTFL
jgi:hypothetical protein